MQRILAIFEDHLTAATQQNDTRPAAQLGQDLLCGFQVLVFGKKDFWFNVRKAEVETIVWGEVAADSQRVNNQVPFVVMLLVIFFHRFLSDPSALGNIVNDLFAKALHSKVTGKKRAY